MPAHPAQPAPKKRPRGRPRTGRISHTRRPPVSPSRPHHVTVRMRPGTWNLRAQRCYQPLLRAFRALRTREHQGFRITHFSVQGNHVHMLAEARDRRAMSNGLRALLIRFARKLNALMHASGPRFTDRYHETILATPSSVHRCLRYVLENHAHHMAKIGKTAERIDPFSSAPWFDGYDAPLPHATADPRAPVSSPRSALLSRLWRRHGLLPTRD